MDSGLLTCKETDFQRPPDWRWRLAQISREEHRRWRLPAADYYVTKARDYRERLERVREPWDVCGLSERYPDLHAAVELATAEPLTSYRHEIEARFLARQEPRDIARSACYRTEAVRWFGLLFYDLGERAGCDSFVYHRLLGPLVHQGLNDNDYGLIWKILGHAGGLPVLEAALTRLVTRPVQAADQVAAFYQDQFKSLLGRRRLTELMTFRSRGDSFVKMQLIAEGNKVEDADAQRGGGGGQTVLVACVESFLRNMSLQLADAGPIPDPEDLVDEARREPRAVELLQQLGKDGPPPERPSGGFPPPVKKKETPG